MGRARVCPIFAFGQEDGFVKAPDRREMERNSVRTYRFFSFIEAFFRQFLRERCLWFA